MCANSEPRFWALVSDGLGHSWQHSVNEVCFVVGADLKAGGVDPQPDIEALSLKSSRETPTFQNGTYMEA